MNGEPVAGEPGGGERAWLLDQVGGSGHHDQVILAAQLRLGRTVEAEHGMVVAADDQQRGRPHLPQPWAGKIGRPPRDITAAMSAVGSAAASKAAAAPVLAPK